MHLDGYTLALQTVNFAVLVWLLHRVLYRPVLRMVDARRAQIDGQYEAARKAAAAAKEQLTAIAAERASIAAERAGALAGAAAEADALKRARRATAEHESAALLDAARKTLASEREQALEALERAALSLATGFLARLLTGLPQEAQADGWLERIERHLASLPAGERGSLSHQLCDTTPLTVVTASALAPQSLEVWRAKLASAVGSDAITFAVDPALGAGAELHFPGAVLAFSLRSAIERLQSELGTAHPS